jgi:DNA recombination protein Rad52
MTGFTDAQLAALGSSLAAEHVRERDQGGRKVPYLESWHVIAEANRLFGFDGWDRELVECRCVTEKETIIGRDTKYQKDGWRVAYIARARVTVRAGNVLVVREGTGYGSGIDVDLGAAHESAIKEAESDAGKRALMTFGNPLGLALYDKARTHVEAPQKLHGAGWRPPALNGAPPSPHPPAPAQPTEKQQLRLSQIRDQMMARISAAASLDDLNTLRREEAENLELITTAHRDTGGMLRRLFDLREGVLNG